MKSQELCGELGGDSIRGKMEAFWVFLCGRVKNIFNKMVQVDFDVNASILMKSHQKRILVFSYKKIPN